MARGSRLNSGAGCDGVCAARLASLRAHDWRPPSVYPQRRYNFKMLCVVHTSDYSACTFVRPRGRQDRNPRACLICPITDSTIALRLA